MLKVGIMVSGGGTNLQAIIDKINSGYLTGMKIEVVVSSKEGIYALQRAKNNNISTEIISRKNYNSLEEYDIELVKCFEAYKVDFIVMAGFLSMIGDGLVEKYKNKVINIHPSLIPSFCGKGYYGIIPHRKALEYGVKVTGATVHFVWKDYDSGPIILQKSVKVLDDDTPEILQRRVMEQAEWKILPRAIKLFIENRLIVNGRKVEIIKFQED
jgi:phosphoribosylglycinamide formyltransferase-1